MRPSIDDFIWIAGLLSTMGAYCIVFTGIWVNWRKRWIGRGMVITGFVVFAVGMGAIVYAP
jgi:hypothetical protein